MAYCAYCGGLIREGGNMQMFKSLGKSMGLEIVGDAIGGVAKLAGQKKYCSEKCKRAAEGGTAGSGSSSSGSSGSSGSIIGNMLKNEREQNRIDEEKIASLEEIPNTINFEGGSDEISNSLNDCFSKYHSIGSTGFFASNDIASVVTAKKAAKAALLQKAEFGIIKLRKIDPDMADFFQKKYDDIVNPPKKGFLGKKK